MKMCESGNGEGGHRISRTFMAASCQIGTWMRAIVLGIVGLLLLAAPASAAETSDLDVSVWSVVPFVALLLCIAVLPLAAEDWWHQNRNKGIVGAALALPVVGYLVFLEWGQGQPAFAVLGEKLLEYA